MKSNIVPFRSTSLPALTHDHGGFDAPRRDHQLCRTRADRESPALVPAAVRTDLDVAGPPAAELHHRGHGILLEAILDLGDHLAASAVALFFWIVCVIVVTMATVIAAVGYVVVQVAST